MAYVEGFLAAERRKPMQDVLGTLFADPSQVKRQMVEEVLQFKRRDGVPEALRKIAIANFRDGRQVGGMRSGLASLKVPAAVVWGASDRIIPSAQAQGLPATVAVHVIEGAGHMPHMEQPQQFNTIARQVFLAADEINGTSR
jgi:pyruvate dehydrogenase E2 component (dihydrolipoamide acetyltransferase)